MPLDERNLKDVPKMTAQEHLLMMHLFYLQMMIIKSLVTALKSSGALAPDDLDAYTALIRSEEMSDPAVAKIARQVYQSVAKEYGIQIRFHEK